MTLRDALPMAAARWQPYAMLLAQGHNLNCGKDHKTINPDELNPYKPKKKECVTVDNVWLPWEAVAARLRNCGFV